MHARDKDKLAPSATSPPGGLKKAGVGDLVSRGLTDIEALEQAGLEQVPDPARANEHFERGKLHLNAARFEEGPTPEDDAAFAAFREAIGCDPAFGPKVATAVIEEWDVRFEDVYGFDVAIGDVPSSPIPELYRRGIHLVPDHVELRWRYAQTLNTDDASDQVGGQVVDVRTADEVEAAYRDVLRLDPGHIDARLMVGRYLMAWKRYAEAEVELRHVMTAKPMGEDAESMVSAYKVLADGLVEQDKWDEAVNLCRGCLRLHPDTARDEGYYILGNILIQQGAYQEASDAYHDGLRQPPSDGDPNRRITVLFDLGTTFHKLGAHEDARAAFQEATAVLQEKWRDPASVHNKGRVLEYDYQKFGNKLLAEEQTDEAILLYREGIRAAPDFGDLHICVGIALEHQGKQDEAIDAWHEAIRVNPGSTYPYEELGRFFHEQGRLDEAFQACVTMASLLFVKENEQEWTEGSPTAVHRLFDIAVELGKLEQAARCLAVLPVAGFEGRDARLLYGVICLLQGRKEDAGTAFREVLRSYFEFSPDQALESCDASTGQGWWLWEQGRLQEAAPRFLPYHHDSYRYRSLALPDVENPSAREQAEKWGDCLRAYVDESSDAGAWASSYEHVAKGGSENLTSAWANEQREKKDQLLAIQRAWLEAVPGWTWR